MSLNLDKNKDALVTAWREVMDGEKSTNWALFGYDGLSFDLNLVSKGDGGLDELIEDFNSGKIMYALCRVKVKEKNVEKIVLINWQGEGAPLSRKGTCANHLGHIKSFFKGVHVTINARTDEDVEPDVIVKTVAKATAGEGVHHSMSTDIEAQGIIGPIGTTYKKVNAKDDINAAAKDEFWRKEEQEEERRKRDEQNKLRKFSQNEVKLLRRESQEYFNEAEAESKHSASTYFANQATASQSKQLNGSTNSNNNSLNNSSVSSASAAAVKASTPMKNSTSGNPGDLVRQRIKSFDGTTKSPINFNTIGANSSGNNNGSGDDGENLSVVKRRQLFETGLSTPKYNIASVKKDPAQEIKLAQEQEKLRLQQQQQQQQKQSQNVTPPKAAAAAAAPVSVTAPTTTSLPTSKFDNNSFDTKVKSSSTSFSQSTSLPAQKLQKTVSPSPSPVPPVVANAVAVNGNSTNAFQTDKQATSGVISEHKNGYGNSGGAGGDAKYVNQYIDDDDSVQSAETHVIDNNVCGVNEREEDTATPTFEILPEMGICARALYDYEAADDSEISFDPGDVITNIEQVDEGWWEGLGPHGVYGLFPSNYVELIEGRG